MRCSGVRVCQYLHERLRRPYDVVSIQDLEELKELRDTYGGDEGLRRQANA